MNNKRFSFFFLALFALFLNSSPVHAYADRFSTGKEWAERMTANEKLISLVAPFMLFHQYGIPIKGTPQQYVDVIDRVLLYNPYLEKEDVSNIFASTVYSYEPQTRESIDEMSKVLKLRANGAGESYAPRLLIRRSPSPDVDNIE